MTETKTSGRSAYPLDSIIGPTVEYNPYKVTDVGFAKVITPLQGDIPNESIVALAEDSHAKSIKVYDNHGLGDLRTYLENGLRRNARQFVRGRARGGNYTRGTVTIPKEERPIFLEPIEPSGCTLEFSMDTSKPNTYQVDVAGIDKPGGFYIPHGYDHPMEGKSVIDVTKYMPREEERQINMIETNVRREMEFYRILGDLFGLNIRTPSNLRDRVRQELRRTYFSDDLAVATHEVIGHYEQDARGMLNPRTASLLGTVPVYDRNLVEAQNVKQTADVIGSDVGYSGLMPYFNQFMSYTGATANDFLVIDPETRTSRIRQYEEFMKNNVKTSPE